MDTSASFCAACGTRLADDATSGRGRRPRLASGLSDRPLATLALVGCLAGLAALLLPLLEAAHGAFTLVTIDLPYVGSILGTLFAVLTLLPVIDLVRGRLRYTPWLCLPATLGLIPVVIVLAAVTELPHLLRWIWAATPEWAVEPGTGPVVFAGADGILLVAGLLAISVRLGARRPGGLMRATLTRRRAVAEPDHEPLAAEGRVLDGQPGGSVAQLDVPPDEMPIAPRSRSGSTIVESESRSGAATVRDRIGGHVRGVGGELGGRLAGLASAQNRERATRQITRGSAHVLAATATWSERAHNRLRSRMATDDPEPTPTAAAAHPADLSPDVDTYTEPRGWAVVEPIGPDSPVPLRADDSTSAGRHRSP